MPVFQVPSRHVGMSSRKRSSGGSIDFPIRWPIFRMSAAARGQTKGVGNQFWNRFLTPLSSPPLSSLRFLTPLSSLCLPPFVFPLHRRERQVVMVRLRVTITLLKPAWSVALTANVRVAVLTLDPVVLNVTARRAC